MWARVCLVMVLAAAGNARAAPCRAAVERCEEPVPDPGLAGYLSVPLELGRTSREHGRFAWGLRPEFLVARHTEGLAFGPYLELARSSDDTALGFGVTATYYAHDSGFSLAPSAGLYHRFVGGGEGGYTGSLFVGHRSKFSPIDLPFGVRVDYRSEGHEVVVSAQLDLMLVVVWYALSQIHGGRM